MTGQVRTRQEITFKTSWACLWLADKERLKALAELSGVLLLGTFQLVEEAKIVQRWTQREKNPWSKASSEATSLASSTATSVARSQEGTAPPVSSPGVAHTPPQLSPIPPPDKYQQESSAGIHNSQLSPINPTAFSQPDSHIPASSLPDPGSSQPAGSESSTLSKSRKRPAEAGESRFKKRRLTRGPKVSVECRSRDGECILAGMDGNLAKVVHIYPVSIIDPQSNGAQLFWKMLSVFWSKQKVNAWQKAVYSDYRNTEKVENLLLMNPWCQLLHGKGLFGLEPTDRCPDGKWVNLRFWWLKKAEKHTLVEDFSVIPEVPTDFDLTAKLAIFS